MSEYHVLLADTLDDLARAVNAGLANGWQPQGGIAVIWRDSWVHEPRFRYYQAMVKG